MASTSKVRPPAPLRDPGSIRRLGLRLFLLSLSVFFAAALFAYLITHLSRSPVPSESAAVLFAMGISTLVLLGSGIAIEVSAHFARSARIVQVGKWLKVTILLAAGFVLVQTYCIASLLAQHELALANQTLSPGMFGLMFCLIAIHAAHVLGGLIPLTFLATRSLLNKLGIEQMPMVRSCASYWHFLELVWLAMFGAFLLTQ